MPIDFVQGNPELDVQVAWEQNDDKTHATLTFSGTPKEVFRIFERITEEFVPVTPILVEDFDGTTSQVELG